MVLISSCLRKATLPENPASLIGYLIHVPLPLAPYILNPNKFNPINLGIYPVFGIYKGTARNLALPL